MIRLPPPPTLPRIPPRPTFPFIAVIAPVAAAIVIGLIVRSPFVLVFALLSPLIAIATVIDGRRTARRVRREEADRFERECRSFELAIARAHADERAQADRRHPLLPADPHAASQNLVRLGSGPSPSAVAPDPVLASSDSDDEWRVGALIASARTNPSLPMVVSRGPLVVRGVGVVADAVIRRWECEPGVAVSRVDDDAVLPPDAIEVRVRSATRIDIRLPGGDIMTARPEFVSRRHLSALVSSNRPGLTAAPPEAVLWSALPPAVGGAIPVGLDARGSVALDLESDGPHVLVGGTTGSGKSEFLRALALGWAAARPPSALQLLFVDFKGGATFAGLTDLPHAVGLVTDLDPVVAERALRGLQAELRRRERVLVEAGVRDIAQAPDALARLVVLVDEFAALIDTFPELHAAFADLAARGRSLGVHLVLCTQSPASVVRDTVAANCGIRIAFRLTPSAGAAFLGAAGRDLGGARPGRAIVEIADVACEVQMATVCDDDIAGIRDRWAHVAVPTGPWLPPLPAVIDHDALAEMLSSTPSSGSAGGTAENSAAHECAGLTFGLLDDPSSQQYLPATWNPRRDGSLVIVGAPRSGRTQALLALAHAAERADRPVVVLPTTVAEAWSVVQDCINHPGTGTLLIADDLDVLMADAADLAADLLERWDAAARALRRSGGAVAASMASAMAGRSLLTGRFESRLVLRCVDADDHHSAGAPRGLFDRTAPPGRGWWAERQVQVVTTRLGVLTATRSPAPSWSFPRDGDAAVVTRRPAAVAARLQATHPHHRVVSDVVAERDALVPGAVPLTPRIVVADPESWQAAWGLFTTLKKAAPIVFAHADAADVRLLMTSRATPPPLTTEAGDVWVVEPADAVRRCRVAALADD